MSAPPSRRSRELEAAEPCVRPGCEGAVVRHLSFAEARKGFPDLPEKGRSAALCREHYKEWKKATKDLRKLDRLGW